MSSEIDYQDPELVKKVWKWTGCEARVMSKLEQNHKRGRVEARTPKKRKNYTFTLEPWNENAPRWQLNHLLKAVKDAGYLTALMDDMADWIGYAMIREPSQIVGIDSVHNILTADSEIIWKAIVDTLIEAEEIEHE